MPFTYLTKIVLWKNNLNNTFNLQVINNFPIRNYLLYLYGWDFKYNEL